MLVRDRFQPQPLTSSRASKPALPAPDRQLNPDQVTISLRQSPNPALPEQQKFLAEPASLVASGPAGVAAAASQAQFRQGLCPYLARATQGDSDWSALDQLRRGLESQKLDPVEFLHGLHQKYGPSFQVGNVIFESRPDVAQQILVATDHTDADRDLFTKSTLQREGLGQVFGNHTVFGETGAAWRSRRAALQPLFLGDRVMSDATHEHLQQITRKHLDALPTGVSVDLNARLRALSLDVALSHLFALELPLEELEKMAEVFARAGQQTQAGVLGLNRRDPELEKDLNAIAERLLANPDSPLRQALPGLDRQTLREEALMMAMLGHETTANLITWSAAQLVKHPRSLENMRHEYNERIGTDPGGYQAVVNLKEVRKIIRESAALHAPNYLISREARRDLDVITPGGQLHVPAGAQVVMAVQEVNREADAGHNEEWDPDDEAGRMYAFGGGHRVCLGQVLARLEAAVVLTRLFQRFDLQPMEQTSLAPHSDLATRPRDSHYILTSRAQ